MPRNVQELKCDQYESNIIAMMVKAVAKTTPQERFDHIVEWCKGNHEWHYDFCRERDITPIAFLLASLIEVEHPLICDGKNLSYTITGSMIEILKVALYKKVVHIPCVQLPENQESCTQLRKVVPTIHSQETEK